jgi:Na+/melibiose symporter-like transporter
MVRSLRIGQREYPMPSSCAGASLTQWPWRTEYVCTEQTNKLPDIMERIHQSSVNWSLQFKSDVISVSDKSAVHSQFTVCKCIDLSISQLLHTYRCHTIYSWTCYWIILHFQDQFLNYFINFILTFTEVIPGFIVLQFSGLVTCRFNHIYE